MAMQRNDAERYLYLRNRLPADVLGQVKSAAGCWIDCEDENGTLVLLTGDDADFAVDAAMDNDDERMNMDKADMPAVGAPLERQVRPRARTVADHIEQRLMTWRQQHINKSGDRLALDDFMGKDSIDDLVDFVCDEYALDAVLHAAPSMTTSMIELDSRLALMFAEKLAAERQRWVESCQANDGSNDQVSGHRAGAA